MFLGKVGGSGYFNSGTGGGPPTAGDYVPFKYTVGGPAGPTVGLNTFTVPGLAGGSGLDFIIVSNTPETIDDDYDVDYTTGILTRNNVWLVNNTVAGAYRSA